jgi:hypothetical protein
MVVRGIALMVLAVGSAALAHGQRISRVRRSLRPPRRGRYFDV